MRSDSCTPGSSLTGRIGILFDLPTLTSEATFDDFDRVVREEQNDHVRRSDALDDLFLPHLAAGDVAAVDPSRVSGFLEVLLQPVDLCAVLTRIADEDRRGCFGRRRSSHCNR